MTLAQSQFFGSFDDSHFQLNGASCTNTKTNERLILNNSMLTPTMLYVQPLVFNSYEEVKCVKAFI